MKIQAQSYLCWIILVLGMFLYFAESARKGSRKNHRSVPCARGCVRCDGVNGCVQCRSRMFLYINKSRARQLGVCKHDCPSGYFGQRGRSINKCTECEVPNCKTCFTNNYCTSCQRNFYLHAAKCEKECPKNLIANPHTGKCDDKVDCIVGPWSSWSKCARRSPSHSCKYGRKKRTREIVQEPTENGKDCQKLRESKKCKTPPNECICEWNKDIINKWIQRMDKFKRKMRERRRKKGKRRGKKRNKRRKVEDNSTIPRLLEHKLGAKNMTSLIGHSER